MNVYQKVSVFALRLTGFGIFVYLALGVTSHLAFEAGGGTSAITMADWASTGGWVLIAGVLLFLGEPIGRFLGRGLD